MLALGSMMPAKKLLRKAWLLILSLFCWLIAMKYLSKRILYQSLKCMFFLHHTYPEIWKKYCDDTRLRFCVGIDLCHILVRKNQKNQIFPLAPTEILQFQNMASIKTNKIKKRAPLHYINFWKLTTLLFFPKRFRQCKGPKNAICLLLSLR